MTTRRFTTFAIFATTAGLATLLAAIASALVFAAPGAPVPIHSDSLDPREPVVHQLPRVVVSGTVQRNPTAQVVELPRVVVSRTVQRKLTAQVVELPRVVVTGRIATATPTLLTQAGPDAAPGT